MEILVVVLLELAPELPTETNGNVRVINITSYNYGFVGQEDILACIRLG